MGSKTNPFSFRLGVIEDWKSRWFHAKRYRAMLREDYLLRKFLFEKFRKFGLEKIEIERSANKLTILIFTSRPGLIIGKGGGGIETLKADIDKKYRQIGSDAKTKTEIKIQIEEVTKPETHAQIVAQQIADQLEKRMPFRRTMKQALEKVVQNKEVGGAKVKLAGRLDGSEMSRVEWLGKGRMPLATLRAKIDFATANAYCTYGVIGVKVWIYKGEVFNQKTERRT